MNKRDSRSRRTMQSHGEVPQPRTSCNWSSKNLMYKRSEEMHTQYCTKWNTCLTTWWSQAFINHVHKVRVLQCHCHPFLSLSCLLTAKIGTYIMLEASFSFPEKLISVLITNPGDMYQWPSCKDCSSILQKIDRRRKFRITMSMEKRILPLLKMVEMISRTDAQFNEWACKHYYGHIPLVHPI